MAKDSISLINMNKIEILVEKNREIKTRLYLYGISAQILEIKKGVN